MQFMHISEHLAGEDAKDQTSTTAELLGNKYHELMPGENGEKSPAGQAGGSQNNNNQSQNQIQTQNEKFTVKAQNQIQELNPKRQQSPTGSDQSQRQQLEFKATTKARI